MDEELDFLPTDFVDDESGETWAERISRMTREIRRENERRNRLDGRDRKGEYRHVDLRGVGGIREVKHPRGKR